MCRVCRYPVLGVLLLASGTAHAGTLTGATWLQVTDGGFQTQGVPMTRSFGQLGASGTSTASSIAVSLSYPPFATTVFSPGYASAYDFAIQINQGGAQAITATPGMGTGTQGIPGTVAVMTAAHVGMGVNQSMFLVGQTLVQVPLSHGKAGQFTNTFYVGGITHFLTVTFYAWTPGTRAFSGLTSLGNSLPNVSAMGSFNLTANGGGTVTLVSPSKVSIDGGVSQRRTVGITTLVLTFVPEPSALLLLGAGVLALELGTRRRRP